MLERFMENCKKPAGRFGRLVLKGDNAAWRGGKLGL